MTGQIKDSIILGATTACHWICSHLDFPNTGIRIFSWLIILLASFFKLMTTVCDNACKYAINLIFKRLRSRRPWTYRVKNLAPFMHVIVYSKTKVSSSEFFVQKVGLFQISYWKFEPVSYLCFDRKRKIRKDSIQMVEFFQQSWEKLGKMLCSYIW
jgi:hypothetical protein